MLPTVPKAWSKALKVTQEGEEIVFTYTPNPRSNLTNHDISEYIVNSIGYNDHFYLKDVGEFNKLDFQILEHLGNMTYHPSFKEGRASIIRYNPSTGQCVLVQQGMVDARTMERMNIKFQVAASLTNEEAMQRYEKIFAAGQFDPSPNNLHSGGTGWLMQRALAEGEIQLTFFPDRAVEHAKKIYTPFEFTQVMVAGNAKNTPPNSVGEKAQHQGRVESFYPRIHRDK